MAKYKGKELVCINDKYTVDYLAVFAKNSISYPKEGEIVSLIELVKYPRLKRTGVIVAPYDNQWISGKIFGTEGTVQVSFDINRFTDLLGNKITEKQLVEEIRELALVEILTSPKKKKK